MKGCKTGGRIKGTPNKATVEIKELARQPSIGHLLVTQTKRAHLYSF
jgi:hypothetical protein